MSLRVIIVVAFNFFCLGAIIAQQLIKAGLSSLSLWMGVPAFLLMLALLLIIRDE